MKSPVQLAVEPSQLHLRCLNICGFEPSTELGKLRFYTLLEELGINIETQVMKPDVPLTLLPSISGYLRNEVRPSLNALEDEDRVVIVFPMHEKLDDLLDTVVHPFGPMHASDMHPRPPRLQLDQNGRHFLFLDEGQSGDPNVIEFIGNRYGGVLDRPLGQGGILLTKVGGLITIACDAKEFLLSVEGMKNFLKGVGSLPAPSGVRRRTESGNLSMTGLPRVARPPSEFPDDEEPTKPAERARSATVPPPEPNLLIPRVAKAARVQTLPGIPSPRLPLAFNPSAPHLTAVEVEDPEALLAEVEMLEEHAEAHTPLPNEPRILASLPEHPTLRRMPVIPPLEDSDTAKTHQMPRVLPLATAAPPPPGAPKRFVPPPKSTTDTSKKGRS